MDWVWLASERAWIAKWYRTQLWTLGRQDTRNKKVVSLNPGGIDWMDIFHINLL